jgi:capsid portal protein
VVHQVHDRRSTELGGCEQHSPSYEKRQIAGIIRKLFIYSPNGKKNWIQIILLSEVAAKDEFLNIKNVSRNDMMAAHHVPPQMMGIIPSNVGGSGMRRRRQMFSFEMNFRHCKKG